MQKLIEVNIVFGFVFFLLQWRRPLQLCWLLSLYEHMIQLYGNNVFLVFNSYLQGLIYTTQI